ncbi:hypothetical protein [Priestia endophytica]|uniref:Uncharacterized protein n=1 Tax=Priestia endophytica DSM 13796 TaxID=1121089 RepID=A0A1I6C7D1_9BACI|nr:hypothetical protein [Priestia endophytica]KYG33491.1 hypothetical protein AZF06_21855 [Priestia endophytica]SFQ89077.1 hypothetical protein SAMN02745910_05193 [Priestia endophytica DSM 13796]
MAKKGKGNERTQINVKFKAKETEEFYDWFDNQSNISDSVRYIVYHAIKQYGTGDVLEYGVQERIQMDNILLNSLRDINVLELIQRGSEGRNKPSESVMISSEPKSQERPVNVEKGPSEEVSKEAIEEVIQEQDSPVIEEQEEKKVAVQEERKKKKNKYKNVSPDAF